MDQTKPHNFSLPPINVGNGFVELGALTTLVGSTVAAVLVLANQGPAGIVWGSISAFGSSSVVKACASGATPGWLRQMFNLRTSISDSALGMDLPLSPSFKLARTVRSGMGHPMGVSCDVETLAGASPLVKDHHACSDVYAFDHETQFLLDGLPATPPGDAPKVYTYYSYPFYRSHSTLYQVSLICFSLVKYLEVYFLYRGSAAMAILSATPFTFFLFAAICLEVNEVVSSRRPMEIDGQLDIVSGTIPSVKQLGGSRKVVLGATKIARTSIWWKLIWSIGALLYSVSLIISYVLLGRQTTEVVVMWGIFQLVWLVLRILISHLKEFSEPTAGRPIVANQIDDLSAPMKLRLANLTFAVALCQVHLHTRGLSAYADDSYSTSQIARMLTMPNMREVYVLPRGNVSTVQLNVAAVIGDVALSSAAWMLGSNFTPIDLYDSCIIILNSILSQNQPHRLIAIPAVRVMTAKTTFQISVKGSENAQPLFIPRGVAGGSEVRDREWMYWIPCQSGHWLQFKSSNLSSLGKHMAEVVDDNQLTRTLEAGNLHLSLKNSLEVMAIVDISRKAARILLSILT
ncbi:hypothetical protein CPB84DRAFT_1960694 [Gymnopilus junonius]|uniref:Uncharacterized protein n=1 Tax=Gymnopilus junonius TaxID=109634 RepID=A0A9P5NPQ4_GYMJU|nr:hypothetical protein CPB84DRAFT_1960694 [Gymnopilus junonius]